MKYFTRLFYSIDASTKTKDKVNALVDYFRQASDADKVWAIALLIGNRLKRPVKTSDLRIWASELAGLPLWLIEESYYVVGDLAETLSHIVGERNSKQRTDIQLHEAILELRNLQTATIEEKKEVIIGFWKRGSKRENLVFNKLITGNFRMGLSKQSVIKALAIYLEKDEKEVAHRLMGKWNPAEETMHSLFSEHSLIAKDYLPYPFFLAYPLEAALSSLGNIENWFLEKKYDGIRGQIIIRGNQVFVWSRGEELVTDKFPEFHALNRYLPPGTVIDGEIIPWKEGTPLPFGVMQTRIGRKNLSTKILADAPLVMICYDLMEDKGVDIRKLPLIERRERLAYLLQAARHLQEVLILSPLVDLKSWEEVAHFRANARDEFCEGLMLKRKTSVYETGRRKGDWWKWKIDPLVIDGVLVYAQSGSGRRANLLTDYTFAVWDGGLLVPFAKAYSGLTDKEIIRLDSWIRKHTLEKFGPVRSVKPEQVFEIAFEGINKSTRHKSGVALRFPRIARWREDKPVEEANTKEDLLAILNSHTRTS